MSFSSLATPLFLFIIAYLAIDLLIGLYVARRVKTSTDFILAGRSLSLPIVVATAFATWFGSEVIIATAAEMLNHGLLGVITDPFGTALCLILIGVFFAKKLYSLHHLTIGDYYRERYGRFVEIICSLIIALSYFGWVAAQFIALGIIFQTVTGGVIPQTYGLFIGALVALTYTYRGGMISVAITDFIEMLVIFIGLIAIFWYLQDKAGGFAHVLSVTPVDHFRFIPTELSVKDYLAYIAAWITIGLGSIPQQDVYQRIMSAKNANTARWGSIIAGLLYLSFAMIPLGLALIARVLEPSFIGMDDAEGVIPTLVLNHAPLLLQIIFFGALLSAIMSTASGALLAPATILSRNFLHPLFRGNLTDKNFLRLTRICVIFVAIVAMYLALGDSTIFELVQNSYTFVLVGAFVPLAFGLYTKWANTAGAFLASTFGIVSWLYASMHETEATIVPALIVGFIMSIIGMILGGVLGKIFGPKKSS